jgi:hypothetical protein
LLPEVMVVIFVDVEKIMMTLMLHRQGIIKQGIHLKMKRNVG